MIAFKKIIQGSLNFILRINFSFFQTGNKFIGRQIDIHNLIGKRQNFIGNSFCDFYSDDISDAFVQTFDVLNIDRTDYVDSGLQNFQNILPSFFVRASFHIGVRQFIHDHNFGMIIDDGTNIHFF